MKESAPAYLREILQARAQRPPAQAPPPLSPAPPFGASLRGAGTMALIAEVKVASPSRGPLLGARSVLDLVRAYEHGGATAISVVTEESRFRGSLEILRNVRAASRLPVLRKDFMTEADDVDETVAWGASAMLLIARILDDAALHAMLSRARLRGIDVVVEVHDRGEVARAVHAGADIIGVNNRDLETFRVDMAVSEALAPLMPPTTLRVAESGISSRADVERLQRAGYSAVLVGESLITSADPEGLAQHLLGRPRP